MRFTFPFEALLNMKKNLEELSQLRLAEKMRRLREIEEMIQELQAEILANERAYRAKMEQGVSASEYLVYKQYEEECYRAIERKEEEKLQTEREIEEEQQTLIGLMKERKMFERLKEKQWQRFIEQTNRQDQKTLDEMVLTRYHPPSKPELS
jgi:flagellar FliJ protein